MEIHEAIQQLEFDRAMILFDSSTGETIEPEILKLLNEDNYKTYIADELAISALEEVQQYRAIGTVEECRTAVEKQKPKKREKGQGGRAVNREILFKAKRKNWQELPKEEWWVEGNFITNEREEGTAYIGYIFDVHNGVIEDFDIVEVAPETLCQYTGLTDKNGEKIWENDIAYIRNNGLSGYGIIRYENGGFVVEDKKRDRIYSMFGRWTIRADGNIFDNSELLEGKV